jgi:lysozyme
MMRPSSAAYELIKEYEGLRLHAYQDSAGVWTIGWGHTGDVKRGQSITIHQAEALLAFDIGIAAAAVNRHVEAPLSQNMFDALVSFTFNLGERRLAESTLLKKLNLRDYAAAAAEFGKWVKATIKGKKVTLPGLVRRRAAERAMFVNQEANR